MVSFNQLIGRARAEPDRTRSLIKSGVDIRKTIEDEMLAFGWASVSLNRDGEVVSDCVDDIIEPDVLERAAYSYVRFYRDGGEEHERGGVATLIESMVFTPEKMKILGIDEGALPVGWWIGFKVLDPGVWEKVKNGTYNMFSIEGRALRENDINKRFEIYDENVLTKTKINRIFENVIKYNPNQPRDKNGKWTKVGGGAASSRGSKRSFMSKKEYLRVIHELNTYYSSFKGKRIVHKCIGDYEYEFKNNGFDNYEFLKRRKLE